MSANIPFNRPSLWGHEVDYVVDAVKQGHTSGDGPYTRRCAEKLQDMLGVAHVALTPSCTHALEIAALLLEIAPGDEVILPSYTFVSTANAFALRGAKPRFVDIRPDTLNMDEQAVEQAVNDKTKAIVPVHYGGVGCEMDTLCALAERHRVAIVEDNAHGLLGRYRGRNLGTFGALATLSFHETKNVTCGEGGALLIQDPQYIQRAEIIREKGTNRSRFIRGEVDKYTWVDIGSSYLPSDILAGFLLGQLEEITAIQEARQRVWERYAQRLAPWAQRVGARLPSPPAHCEQSYHLFYVICPSAEQREELRFALRDRGMLGVFHYVPLHLSEMGERYGYRRGDFPVTEDLSTRLLRLPFFNTLADGDIDRVCAVVEEITAGW